MNILKVALVQYKAKPSNLSDNLKLGLKYVKQAKEKGGDIVLFPEMWSNGYAPPFDGAFDNPRDINFEKERQNWLNSAIDEKNNYICSFQKIASELNIGIVITYLSKGKKAPQNTALVIDKNGNILMKYSKVHTCDMNPARLNQLSTRAFENMTAVAMANYPSKGWGQSCAFSPIVFNEKGYVDNKILLADDTTEDIFIAEFDMDRIRDYRKKETWGNAYRKVNAYGSLLDIEIKEPFIRK